MIFCADWPLRILGGGGGGGGVILVPLQYISLMVYRSQIFWQFSTVIFNIHVAASAMPRAGHYQMQQGAGK